MNAQTPFSRAVAGFHIPEAVIEVDRLALVKYAGAADDYVRQHWDHPFMIEQGYPDVIGHGWLSFAHICRAVTDWAPPALARIERFAVRYHRPFHPGSLTCGGMVESVDMEAGVMLSLWARDAEGVTIATGSVTLKPL